MGGIVAKEASPWIVNFPLYRRHAYLVLHLTNLGLYHGKTRSFLPRASKQDCGHGLSRHSTSRVEPRYLSKNLLRASAYHGTKPYVSDLERVSASLIKVNDTFRHYCDSLTLYSFFETKELSMGPTSALIVPKDSAVLGLPGERVSLMYADHRSICKFETPEDPGYITLTEALNTINMETSKRRTLGQPPISAIYLSPNPFGLTVF
jgi:hypothetical protein